MSPRCFPCETAAPHIWHDQGTPNPDGPWADYRQGGKMGSPLHDYEEEPGEPQPPV